MVRRKDVPGAGVPDEEIVLAWLHKTSLGDDGINACGSRKPEEAVLGLPGLSQEEAENHRFTMDMNLEYKRESSV